MKRWTPVIDRSAAIGVALMTVFGVGAGLAMKPSARELIGPEGPQTLMPVSGERVQNAGGQSAFAAYKYGIPDWVIGTDWLQRDVQEIPVETESADYQPEPYEPPEFVTIAEREPEPDYAPPPRRYPSMHGDIYAVGPEPPQALEPPQPPEPPQALEPPEALEPPPA